jgi:hypothetical protein
VAGCGLFYGYLVLTDSNRLVLTDSSIDFSIRF